MTEHYGKAFAEDVAFNVDWTWDDATAKYGRSKDALRNALLRLRKTDLIARLDKNSKTPNRKPYMHSIIELVAIDEGITWDLLAYLLKREEATIKQYLYQNQRADLVKLIEKNSKGV